MTIDSYQTDENGNRVEDSFGTDYPDYVTFELIPEALEDGYVPLQVFVPIILSFPFYEESTATWIRSRRYAVDMSRYSVDTRKKGSS